MRELPIEQLNIEDKSLISHARKRTTCRRHGVHSGCTCFLWKPAGAGGDEEMEGARISPTCSGFVGVPSS